MANEGILSNHGSKYSNPYALQYWIKEDIMEKTDALKHAIDGKRIKLNDWPEDDFIYWDGSVFRSHEEGDDKPCDVWSFGNDGWVIVLEKVDFQEAYKAYKQGQKIISMKTLRLFSKSMSEMQFQEKEIDGKWKVVG